MINKMVIKNIITPKHSEFIKEYSSQLDKVVSDDMLLRGIAITKMKYVLDIFIESNIIDTIDEVVEYNQIIFSKKGHNNKIRLFTNGIIAASEYHGDAMYIMNNVGFDRLVFKDINSDDFDWNKFSESLLSQIHKVIYSREHAINQKLDVMLSNLHHERA